VVTVHVTIFAWCKHCPGNTAGLKNVPNRGVVFTYRDFPRVCSGMDLCILPSSLTQTHIRNNPTALVRGGFADRAIATLGSK